MSANKLENAEENVLRYTSVLLNAIPGTAWRHDHKFKLKPGFIVMPVQNIQPANGQVNRARCIMKTMTNNVLFLLFVYVS